LIKKNSLFREKNALQGHKYVFGYWLKMASVLKFETFTAVQVFI